MSFVQPLGTPHASKIYTSSTLSYLYSFYLVFTISFISLIKIIINIVSVLLGVECGYIFLEFTIPDKNNIIKTGVKTSGL